jgi:hypothetical protein
MNEEERAEWLARAIDDLLNRDRSRPKEPPPPELDGQELNALMRIAHDRAETAQSSFHTGLQYEGAVWRRVLERLDRRRTSREVRPLDASGPGLDDADAARALDQMEIDELREIARLRRALAERAVSMAETHREDVWDRVQSRLQAHEKKRRTFTFFLPRGKRDRKSEDLDAIVTGRNVRDSGEEDLNGLMDVARVRQRWSQSTRRAAADSQDRVWTRIERRISAGEPRKPRVTAQWPKLAAAGAVAALVIAALGPVPATGLADHPVAGLVRSLGEHLGVRETATPPAPPPATAVLEGSPVTVAEASQRLGTPVAVPAQAPTGFELISERFFEQALSADAGGMFALTYVGTKGSSLVVYQERATGDDFAVGSGAATDIALADGTAGTYVAGSWQAVGGELVWSEGGAQTLIFERGGVRTTIQYTGLEAEAPSLFAVADSLSSAP